MENKDPNGRNAHDGIAVFHYQAVSVAYGVCFGFHWRFYFPSKLTAKFPEHYNKIFLILHNFFQHLLMGSSYDTIKPVQALALFC